MDVAEENLSLGEQKLLHRGVQGGRESACCPERGDRGRDCMSDDAEAAYHLQAPSAEPPRMSISSRRLCSLLKATRLRLSITSLLKDTFNYAPSPGISSSMNSVFLWHVHLDMARPGSTCCFLLPIKEHVDRLRLLLVRAPLRHLGKMMNIFWGWWCWWWGGPGVSNREKQKRERTCT